MPLCVCVPQVANIDYDVHLGRIAVGRVVNGSIKKGQQVSICSSLEPGQRYAKITELFVYDNFNKVAVEEVKAGDICALCGISVSTSDTHIHTHTHLHTRDTRLMHAHLRVAGCLASLDTGACVLMGVAEYVLMCVCVCVSCAHVNRTLRSVRPSVLVRPLTPFPPSR